MTYANNDIKECLEVESAEYMEECLFGKGIPEDEIQEYLEAYFPDEEEE